MDESKTNKLKKYAKEKGFQIDEESTAELRSQLSDATITIRIPSQLRDLLKVEAQKKNIPYQRYIKTILIDSLKKQA